MNIEEKILNTSLHGFRSLLVLFLSAGFLGIGMMKIVGYPDIADYFNVWGFPLWVMYAVGIVELILCVGVFYLPTRKYAIFGIIILMLGAMGVHIYQNEFEYAVVPFVIGLSALILGVIERNISKSEK